MTNRDERRRQLLDAMTEHLLASGLTGSPLRALAAAAGTSDRMLLYYFVDKDELLAALLDHVAARLVRLLDQDGRGPQPFADLLRDLLAAARSPLLRPYMLLFMELAAAAGRGEEPQKTAAAGITARFIEWVAGRLSVVDAAERRARAALLLATLDGLFVLDCAGHADAATAAVGGLGR